eukprot:RCo017942
MAEVGLEPPQCDMEARVHRAELSVIPWADGEVRGLAPRLEQGVIVRQGALQEKVEPASHQVARRGERQLGPEVHRAPVLGISVLQDVRQEEFRQALRLRIPRDPLVDLVYGKPAHVPNRVRDEAEHPQRVLGLLVAGVVNPIHPPRVQLQSNAVVRAKHSVHLRRGLRGNQSIGLQVGILRADRGKLGNALVGKPPDSHIGALLEPGLGANPSDGILTIFSLSPCGLELPFGHTSTANILDDDVITVGAEHLPNEYEGNDVVRSADQDSRKSQLSCIPSVAALQRGGFQLRLQSNRVQPHAVTHWDKNFLMRGDFTERRD